MTPTSPALCILTFCLLPLMVAPAAAAEARLVIRDRSGSHVIAVHNGRAVDARRGSHRVYSVQDGIFVIEVCVCSESCARRFKPAFYCLVATACLLASAAVAAAAAGVAARLRRGLADDAEASAETKVRRPLFSGIGGGGLSVQCDPVVPVGDAGASARSTEKVAI